MDLKGKFSSEYFGTYLFCTKHTSFQIDTHFPQVSLYKLVDSLWTIISESCTNTDGRCLDLLSRSAFNVGRYKLHFDVENYFKELQIASLYPFIEVNTTNPRPYLLSGVLHILFQIVFDCSNDEDDHYHIPLLLNPFGYSTYRGT